MALIQAPAPHSAGSQYGTVGETTAQVRARINANPHVVPPISDLQHAFVPEYWDASTIAAAKAGIATVPVTLASTGLVSAAQQAANGWSNAEALRRSFPPNPENIPANNAVMGMSRGADLFLGQVGASQDVRQAAIESNAGLVLDALREQAPSGTVTGAGVRVADVHSDLGGLNWRMKIAVIMGDVLTTMDNQIMEDGNAIMNAGDQDPAKLNTVLTADVGMMNAMATTVNGVGTGLDDARKTLSRMS